MKDVQNVEEPQSEIYNNFKYTVCNIEGKICGFASLDEYDDFKNINPVRHCAAICIGKRSYNRYTRPGDKSKDAVVYFLLVVLDGSSEDCWRRIGVCVTRDFGNRPYKQYSGVFDGCE